MPSSIIGKLFFERNCLSFVGAINKVIFPVRPNVINSNTITGYTYALSKDIFSTVDITI